MPTATRTFRVFVSSTFEDLKEERNALQRDVFPRLAKLCEEHGARFQAIDLRWGVRDEAGLDQKTMEICLAEIERCKKTNLKPNFIVLLGDRYGWRPLPARIEAGEFERIGNAIDDDEERALVDNWYRRDDNAVPPEYLLKPRTGEFTDAHRWGEVEGVLRAVLSEAARNAGVDPDGLTKYEASATHQEILKGLGRDPEDREHVFAFLRKAKEGQDPDLENLKEALKQQLGENVFSFGTGDYDELCGRVWETLERVILYETARFEFRSDLDLEIDAQNTFADGRSKHFVGRAPVLNAIDEYLRSDDRRPMVIRGASGSGKSALMAKASGEESGIRRFIGATPESSNGLTLLRSLCQEIARSYGRPEDVPATFNELAVTFVDRIRLATPERPLLLFLDALDQLGPQDPAAAANWLPAQLPRHCKVVVSTIEVPAALQWSKLLVVEPFSAEEANQALALWFEDVQRALQKEQREKLLASVRRSPLPLYLKLAFEEARRWKSFTPIEQCDLGEGLAGIIDRFFSRLSEESAHGPVLVSHALGYLAASRYGLTEGEMLDLLSADERVWLDFNERAKHAPPSRMLPVIVWSRFFLDVEPYLTERAVTGGTVISFYHRQFSEHVFASRLNDESRDRHEALAGYFLGQADPDGSTRWRSPNPRPFMELPFHLLRAGLWRRLSDVLTDFGFLAAKCARDRNGIYDLQLDFSTTISEWPQPNTASALQRMAIEAMGEILRRHHHEWDSAPNRLPQQVYPWLRWWKHEGPRSAQRSTALMEWCDQAAARFTERGGVVWLRQVTCPLYSAEVACLEHDGVSRAFFIPSEHRVLSVGRDIKLWDSHSFQQQPCACQSYGSRRLHASTLVGAASIFDSPSDLSRTGLLAIATGMTSNTVHRDSGCQLAVISVTSGESVAIWNSGDIPLCGIAWSPAGDAIATSHVDGSVLIWAFPSGSHVRILEPNAYGGSWEDPEYPMPGYDWPARPAFSPDGALLVVGRREQCFMWKLKTTELIGCVVDPKKESVLPGTRWFGNRGISTVEFSPDCMQLACGMWDGAIRVWDVATLAPHDLLPGPSRMITDLAWSRFGLVACYAYGDCRVWQVGDKPPTSSRLIQCTSTPTSIVLSPDGENALVTEQSGNLHVVSLAGNQSSYWAAETPTWESEALAPLVASRFHSVVVSGSTESICVVDGLTGFVEANFCLSRGHATAVACNPSTVDIYIGSSIGEVWVTTPNGEPALMEELQGLGKILSLQCSADGSTLLVETASAGLLTLDLRLRRVSSIGVAKQRRGAISRDGSCLAFAPGDSEDRVAVEVYRKRLGKWWRTRNIRFPATDDGEIATAVIFSPDGSQILVGGGGIPGSKQSPCNGAFCVVIDSNTGHLSRIFRGRDTDFVSALDISIDGDLIAFATMAEEMIRIWSCSDARFVKEIRGGHTLRWSPRGQLLAIGAENQISVWNGSGAPLATFVGRGSRSNVEWLNEGIGVVFVDDKGEPCILTLENRDMIAEGAPGVDSGSASCG